MFCPLQKDRKIDLLRKHVAAKREAAAAAARAKEEEESRRLEAASGAANGNLRSDTWWSMLRTLGEGEGEGSRV